MKRTQNDLIHIGCPIPFNIEEFLDKLDALMEAAYKNVENIREMVAESNDAIADFYTISVTRSNYNKAIRTDFSS